MFTITTTSTATGIMAKGHGKQRTVKRDPNKSEEGNYGAAVGALLNVLCDERQQAMLRHPSGGQRVNVVPDGDRFRWTVNV